MTFLSMPTTVPVDMVYLQKLLSFLATTDTFATELFKQFQPCFVSPFFGVVVLQLFPLIWVGHTPRIGSSPCFDPALIAHLCRGSVWRNSTIDTQTSTVKTITSFFEVRHTSSIS
jgi:hypothetical protein